METMSRRKFNRIMKQREHIELKIIAEDRKMDFAIEYYNKAKFFKNVAVQSLKEFDNRMNAVVIQETNGKTTNSW